jgi:hypothetical protein
MRAARDLPVQRADLATVTPRATITRSGCALITALPACVNLSLYQGDDFTLRIDVTQPDGDPLDLAGAVVRAQIRATPQADEVAGEFTPTVDGSTIFLHLSSAASTPLLGKLAWDVDVTRGGQVTTLAAGSIEFAAEVSRA